MPYRREPISDECLRTPPSGDTRPSPTWARVPSSPVFTCALVDDGEQIIRVLVWAVAIDTEGDERADADVDPESPAVRIAK